MRKIPLILIGLLALSTATVALARPHHWLIARAYLSDLLPATLTTPGPATLPTSPWAQALIDAAESQVGTTTIYDGAYQRLDYPGGDIPAPGGSVPMW